MGYHNPVERELLFNNCIDLSQLHQRQADGFPGVGLGGVGVGGLRLIASSVDPGLGLGGLGVVDDGVGFFSSQEVNMNDIPEINKDSAGLVLTVLQRQHDIHLAASDILDEKAARLLEWASLALVIVSAISTPELIKAGQTLPVAALIVTLVLYVAIVITSLKVIYPRKYQLPIGIDWDEMCDLYLLHSEQVALQQLLSQYITTIESNKAIAEYKGQMLKRGSFLFPILTLLLAFTAMSSLW